MRRRRAWLSWSSGKDSAMALRAVCAEGNVEVTGLLTTVNSSADRVAMHAVRRVLLQAQADALGLPTAGRPPVQPSRPDMGPPKIPPGDDVKGWAGQRLVSAA
jgi:hypothetical protein